MGLCDELLMEPSANQHHKAPPYTPNITVNKIVNLEDCQFY